MSLESRAFFGGAPLRAARRWNALGVSARYFLLVMALALIGTAVLGRWVAAKIERSALEQHAGAAAIYMGHVVPQIEAIRPDALPSAATRAQLDEALAVVGRRFGLEAIKVWSLDGRILYSSNPADEGRRFPANPGVTAAAAGRLLLEFASPSAESRAEFERSDALVEVYAPVRSDDGAVAAVVEFYIRDERLSDLLRTARFETWIVTGGLLVMMFSLAGALVHDGARSFAAERRRLASRISALSADIDSRELLRERVEREARRTIERNARVLQLVGSDLHDGPAQLISLALLRLDALGGDAEDADIRMIRQALRESMAHIRDVAAGLLLEPDGSPGLREAILRVVEAHRAATGSAVALDLSEAPERCPQPVALCLGRVVQEGLANAARHAGGRGQRVRVARADGGIVAEVTDAGPGPAGPPPPAAGPRLGLIGLRVRVESVGGVLRFEAVPGGGATLTAWAPVEGG